MKYHLTDDRVFGKMYYGDMIDFIDLDRLAAAKEKSLAKKKWRNAYAASAATRRAPLLKKWTKQPFGQCEHSAR